MNTIVYIMRHSKPMDINFLSTFDSLQVRNEKKILSLEGDEMAYKKSKNIKFRNLDGVFTSNYVRAISTARYFTDNIMVIDMFGERKKGINDQKELPKDYVEKQLNDFDYKLENGESLNDTQTRMFGALNLLLEKYKGKTILIISHAAAMYSLFSNYCDITPHGDWKFKNELFFNGDIDYLDTFKLTFDEKKNLKYIEHIED